MSSLLCALERLPVSIKLDAYDVAVYGALDGELTYMSPDTLTEQGPGEAPVSYYRAQVRILESRRNKRSQDIAVMLGMSGAADVHVASRTVLKCLA